MAPAVLLVAAVTAFVSIGLTWREVRRRLSERDFYVAPITLFRRELSLAGICTAATTIVWVALMPSSVRLAAIALFPTFFYFFLVTARRPG